MQTLVSVDVVSWQVKTSEFIQIILCSSIVVLAVVQSGSEPETLRLAGALFAAVLAALFVGRDSGWCSELLTVGFLFCLMMAARAVVPTPLSFGNDVILYLRPAGILVVVAVVTGMFRRSPDVVPYGRLVWQHVLIGTSIALGALTLTGYLLLFRLYLLETAVLRTTLLNIMLVLAGYIAFSRLQARVESKRLPTILVLIALAGMFFAKMLGNH